MLNCPPGACARFSDQFLRSILGVWAGSNGLFLKQVWHQQKWLCSSLVFILSHSSRFFCLFPLQPSCGITNSSPNFGKNEVWSLRRLRCLPRSLAWKVSWSCWMRMSKGYCECESFRGFYELEYWIPHIPRDKRESLERDFQQLARDAGGAWWPEVRLRICDILPWPGFGLRQAVTWQWQPNARVLSTRLQVDSSGK